jgi:hypothetical protein
MHSLNLHERWTYKGSVTTPPCKTNVYWNVARTIYPVKQRHVDLFKKQLARTDGLDKTGNWRVIVPTTPAHNPMIVEDDTSTYTYSHQPGSSGGSTASSGSTSSAQSSTTASSGATPVTQQGTITIQHTGFLTA